MPSKKELCKQVEDLKKTIEDAYSSPEFMELKLKQQYELKERELVYSHNEEIMKLKFKLDNFESTKIEELNKLLSSANTEISVLKKENDMLNKMIDVNTDIVDVKTLVEKLIQKLPNIDIKNLTIGESSNK
jgi:hypothetical protein